MAPVDDARGLGSLAVGAAAGREAAQSRSSERQASQVAQGSAQLYARSPCRSPPSFARYEQVILDLDGCVWVGGSPSTGSPEAIAALRAAGKRVAFVTNNSRSRTEDYVPSSGAGMQASLADVVTSGGAMQHLLAETRPGRTAFVIGTRRMHRHVGDAGLGVLNGTDLASRAEVVVVGGTEEFTYDDLRTATLAVQRGADFLATARDPTYPMPDGLMARARARCSRRWRRPPGAPRRSWASPSPSCS